jgi:hypothetical protein
LSIKPEKRKTFKTQNGSKQTLPIPLYNSKKSTRSGLFVSAHITEQLPPPLKVVFFGFGLALMPNMTGCLPNRALNLSSVICGFIFQLSLPLG